MPILLCLQELQEESDGEWRIIIFKKCHRFSLDQKIASAWKNAFLLAFYSTSDKFLLVARHSMTIGLMAFLKACKLRIYYHRLPL